MGYLRFTSLVYNYLEADKSKKCVFLDSSRHNETNRLLTEDLSEAFGQVWCFSLDEFTNFQRGTQLPKRVEEAVLRSDWIIQSTKFYPEYVPFINTVHNRILRLLGKKLVVIQGLTAEELVEATAIIKQEIIEASSKLVEIFTNPENQQLTITNPAGTELSVKFSSKYGWIKHDMRDDSPIIPNGEIETYCPNVDGIMVADGSIFSTLELLSHEPPLDDWPITLTIKDSMVTHVECPGDPNLEAVLKMHMKNENRLGEVGIAFNHGITRFRGYNNVLDERLPNFHIGIGQGDFRVGELPFESDYHTDFMMAKTTIETGGQTVMKSGKLVL